MNILFSKLTELFPKDTMWIDGCAEIIGYSPKENLHIVIDDGQCKSDNGMYMVHKYHPLDQRMHMLDWNSGKYPLKYLTKSAKKVFEGWVDFSDTLKVKEVDLELVNPCENCEGDGLAGTCASISELGRCPLKYRKQELVNEDLEELINKLSAQFPEVSFAKLSRIAVRVAKWQRNQDKMVEKLMAKNYATGFEAHKQQMIKEAITGQLENGEDYLRIKCLYTSCRPQDDGKLVKLIIIREE